MIAPQSIVCFLLWIGYGAFIWRRGERSRERIGRLPRVWKVAGGAGLLLLGAAWLVAGLLAVQHLGGAAERGLKPWAWPAVFAVGLGFVHAQVFATALIAAVILDDPASVRQSSIMEETEDQEP